MAAKLAKKTFQRVLSLMLVFLQNCRHMSRPRFTSTVRLFGRARVMDHDRVQREVGTMDVHNDLALSGCVTYWTHLRNPNMELAATDAAIAIDSNSRVAKK